MGVMSGIGTDTHSKEISKDVSGGDKFETDVKGVFADKLKNGMPVFNVTPDEFNQNMKNGRKRLRFKSGTPAAQYFRNTKYNKPFWIQNTKDGFIRKIK